LSVSYLTSLLSKELMYELNPKAGVIKWFLLKILIQAIGKKNYTLQVNWELN
jgi:hypothetical protein